MADSGRILTLWSPTDNLWKRIEWSREAIRPTETDRAQAPAPCLGNAN
jgi:hypothetical protein